MSLTGKRRRAGSRAAAAVLTEMNELEDGGRSNTDMGAYISVGRREEERKGVREREKNGGNTHVVSPITSLYGTLLLRAGESRRRIISKYIWSIFSCPTFILWLSQDKGASIMQLNGKIPYLLYKTLWHSDGQLRR